MSKLENEIKPENTELISDPATTAEGKVEPTKSVDPEPKKEAEKGPVLPKQKLNKNMPIGPGNFWNNMLSTLLLLILVTAAFSYLTETKVEPEQLSITDVVGQVKAGEVDTIVVRGATL